MDGALVGAKDGAIEGLYDGASDGEYDGATMYNKVIWYKLRYFVWITVHHTTQKGYQCHNYVMGPLMVPLMGQQMERVWENRMALMMVTKMARLMVRNLAPMMVTLRDWMMVHQMVNMMEPLWIIKLFVTGCVILFVSQFIFTLTTQKC